MEKREITPSYYHKFHCIADKCKHNCCIGWEIDVDTETMEKYRAMKGDIGDRIRENIVGDPPHFRLNEGDRCPFLADNGLCEIICGCGDEALCEICRMHPRFVNSYDSFCEIGIGMSCEECARIIISEKEPFSLELPRPLMEDERDFFAARQKIIDILQNRDLNIKKRFELLCNDFEAYMDYDLGVLIDFYLGLERLDDKWTEELNLLRGFEFKGEIFRQTEMQLAFEQLSVYFVFRHSAKVLEYCSFEDVIRFALCGCFLIGALWERYASETGEISTEKMADFARMYSSEIEYSEENTDAVMFFDI